MRPQITLALLLVATLRFGAAHGQSETHVEIRVLSAGTCLVFEVHVPCRDVGTKLHELGTPSDVTIHVNPEKEASYDAVYSTFEALKRAGFRVKVGYVNVAPP